MMKFRKMLKDKKGATAIEYGLIAALIAVAAITAMSQLGTQLRDTLTDAQSSRPPPPPRGRRPRPRREAPAGHPAQRHLHRREELHGLLGRLLIRRISKKAGRR